MAGKGFAPKEQRSRPDQDRARQDEMVKLTETGELYGPELPESHEWPAATCRWWHNWRTSAIAPTLTASDWDFLTDSALLHAKMWGGDTSVAAELRLRVAKYGATPEDRMRLKLQVEKPAPAAAKKPDSAQDKDRRSRLLQAVGE